MTDFDGFVIDATSKDTLKEIFESIITYEEDETIDDYSLIEMENFVVDYYTMMNMYDIIEKQPHLYYVKEI